MPTRAPYNFNALLDPACRVPELSIEPDHPKPWLVFTTLPPSVLNLVLERRFHAKLSGYGISFPMGPARLVVRPEDFDGHSTGTLFVFLGGPHHMMLAAQRAMERARAQGLKVRSLVPKEAGQ